MLLSYLVSRKNRKTNGRWYANSAQAVGNTHYNGNQHAAD